MTKKNKIISILILLFLIISFFIFFREKNNDLNKIKNDNPELTQYVDDILKDKNLVAANPNDPEKYNTLGMAWKSLGDMTKNNSYYEEALKVYEKGIELTNRKNIVFLVNAGNVNKLMGKYDKAEEYYKESISVSPGEYDTYRKLIELYTYNLKKSKEEITAVYDQALKSIVLDRDYVQRERQDFIQNFNK